MIHSRPVPRRLHRRAIAATYALALLHGFPAAAAQSPEALRQELRALIVAGRPVTPIRPTTLLTQTASDLQIERVAFESEPGQRIVAVIHKPAGPATRWPVIVWQHWYNGHKDHALLTRVMQEAARRGFLCVAIDGRYRGERSPPNLQDALIEALRNGKGHPWIIDTVYDLVRVADWLESRADVDPRRLGLAGVSEGGFVAWVTAAIDERYAVVAPLIGVTRWSVEMSPWLATLSLIGRIALMPRVYEAARVQLGEDRINARVVQFVDQRLLPGFRDRYDPIKVVPLIAPRPLLICAHEKDLLIPLAGTREVYEAARHRYAGLGLEARVKLRIAPGLGHEAVDEEEIQALVSWFELWFHKEKP